jgi:hypothetical protein
MVLMRSAMFAKVQVIPLSRRKQGFDSPWARQENQALSFNSWGGFRRVRKLYGKHALELVRTMAAKSLDPPPTIAHLKAQGLTSVCPVCRACQHSGAVAFDALRLPDETPFPDIGRARRFRCSACGARDCAVAPNWQRYSVPEEMESSGWPSVKLAKV